MKRASLKGWCVKSPSGKLLISTVSRRKSTCKKLLLDPVEQRYNGLVERNFCKWADVGYEAVRVFIKEQEPK